MRGALAEYIKISIHALREEGDSKIWQFVAKSFRISIHALREEGDILMSMAKQDNYKFLSTPSARRATPSVLCGLSRTSHFYPRPPRGGRPGGTTPQPRIVSISIHALREEGDLRCAGRF